MSLSMSAMSENQVKQEASSNEKINALKMRIGALEDELEEGRDLLKLQIANQQKEQEEFVLLIDQKENESKEVMRRLHDAQSDLAMLTQHIEGTLAQLKDSEKENQDLASALDVQLAKVMKLESEIQGQRAALDAGSDLEKQLANVTSRITESEARAADLTIKLGDARAELEAKKTAFAAQHEELKEEQRLRAQGATLTQRLQQDLEHVNAKLETAVTKQKVLGIVCLFFFFFFFLFFL